jgi:general secretion pathway protein A
VRLVGSYPARLAARPMYVRHYGLSARPFQLGAARRFFYPCRAQRVALHRLVETLAAPGGLALLSGDPGLGKSTLLDTLASLLSGRRLDLVRIDGREPVAPQLSASAGEPGAWAGRFLLLIDDAENLGEQDFGLLPELLDRDDTVPAHAILAGGPSLEQTLALPGAGSIRDRLITAHEMGPLGPEEIRPYLEHRLRRAGWTGAPAFTDAVSEAVHHHTRGNPRAVNLLMSRVLLLGALDRMTTIDRAAVDRAAAEIALEDAPLRPPPAPSGTPSARFERTRDVSPPGGRQARADRGAPADPEALDPMRREVERLRLQLHRLDLERLRQDTETSRRLISALSRQDEARFSRRFPFLPRFARSF